MYLMLRNLMRRLRYSLFPIRVRTFSDFLSYLYDGCEVSVRLRRDVEVVDSRPSILYSAQFRIKGSDGRKVVYTEVIKRVDPLFEDAEYESVKRDFNMIVEKRFKEMKKYGKKLEILNQYTT